MNIPEMINKFIMDDFNRIDIDYDIDGVLDIEDGKSGENEHLIPE
jgi:hypothetical protein